MAVLLVTLTCVLASASSQTTEVAKDLHGKKPAGASLRANQLRAVLSWHCGRSVTSQYHIEDTPCQNFRFMHESGFEAGPRASMAIESDARAAAHSASMKAKGATPHPNEPPRPPPWISSGAASSLTLTTHRHTVLQAEAARGV